MNKKNTLTKDNVISFPSKLTDAEREIEAIIFAAAEPLDIDTIESKLAKKTDIQQCLDKLQKEGVLDISRRQITIFDIHRLFEGQ